MVIKPFAPRDRDVIHRILRQRGTFTVAEIKGALEILDESLRHPKSRAYYAFCAFDGRIDPAGYICFGPIPMTERCFDLYWIAVDEASARKGIGGRLLQFMEKFVGSRGGRRIYVDTSSTSAYTPARAFYEKHGYRTECVLYDFYREGDHKVIYMKEVYGIASATSQDGAIGEGSQGCRSSFPSACDNLP
jgi:ribosomal protein S18 acetylase RimI-like enzyme